MSDSDHAVVRRVISPEWTQVTWADDLRHCETFSDAREADGKIMELSRIGVKPQVRTIPAEYDK